jgi:hypothetical protein
MGQVSANEPVIQRSSPTSDAVLFASVRVRRCSDVPATKTGMLYDAATIRVIASALNKYYVGKPFRPVYESVALCYPDHAEQIRGQIHSFAQTQEGPIPSLAGPVSISMKLPTPGSKVVLPDGGHAMTTMAEVHELRGDEPPRGAVEPNIDPHSSRESTNIHAVR